MPRITIADIIATHIRQEAHRLKSMGWKEEPALRAAIAIAERDMPALRAAAAKVYRMRVMTSADKTKPRSVTPNPGQRAA